MVGKVIGTIVLIMVITGAILACFAAVYIKTVIMPDAHLDGNFTMDQTSTIYYLDSATGEYVEHLSLHGEENRILVTYDEIPEDLINATVAIEDQRFWKHNGVDWRRTLNGVLLMFTGKDIQGGSTITQQLIKNFTQYDDVTVKRKITEIFRALEFDKTYSKEKIMEWYLNYIYLGEGCNGVATAARAYFDKDLSELTLAECASLISITNNPSLYNPYRYLENNQYRAKLVLSAMLEQGYIDQARYDEAVAEIDDLASHLARGENESRPTVIYNWHDEQVITDVINDLIDKYGYSETLATDLVNSGGLKIYSTVDPEIQAIVEEVYADRENLPLVSASGQRIQSAIVIIDPQGNVVGLAGAMGEKEKNRVWNYASRSTRQPGSSIKMLSTYAPALELGLITPATVLDDYPVQLLSGSAWPNNSYGYYKGLTDVSWAVQQSSNPVAVRVLEMLTPDASYDFMTNRFHITTLEPGREINGEYKSDIDVSPLALGGLTDGVRVIEMAAAYSVFPRDGMYIAPRTYTKVTQEVDGQEVVLLDNTQDEPEAVISQETAWYVNDMLKKVVTSGTGTSAQIPGMTVAGKTGSTNSNNDRWFVGYTAYYTAAVWVGYDTPERIKTSLANPAATMWQKVMSRVHEGLENKDFNTPDGLITVKYCKDSGMLATDACLQDPRGSRVGTAYLFQGDAPTESCTAHQTVEVCNASPVKNANGEVIEGLYHKAGEYCPRQADELLGITEPTVITIALLNLERETIGGATARDSSYYMSFLDAQGVCDVHLTEPEPVVEEYDPSTFNIADPSTWPPADDERYQNFDPDNPETWPNYQPEEESPTQTPSGGGQTTPSESPAPSPSPSPSQSEEPYIPAGG